MNAEAAGNSYEAIDGHLTRFPYFGTDPFGRRAELVYLREQQFADIANIQEDKEEVVNGSYRLSRNAIITYT